jgi:hypothetical protein
MSDANPPEATGPLPSFETVGPEGPADSGSRRGAVIAGVAAAVVVVLGGGAYAAYSFLSGGGPQPDEVLPASTIAVVSVDLDPSASQKIAAIKSIRKFPALKKSLGLEADDDLREFIFDKAVEEGDCKGLDFNDDVKPWLGKRAAFAAVELDGKPAPAIALQVSDATEAKKGFDAIVECAEPGDGFGFVVGDDYLIMSDSAAHAKAILDEGSKKPLAGDAAYQTWTDEAGDAGVLNFYVARKAIDSIADQLDAFGPGVDDFDFEDSSLEGSAVGSSAPTVTSDDPSDAFRDQLKDFKGAAGTVRFADGGMELSVAAGGLDQLTASATVGKQASDLPKDTAVVFGIGVPDDFAAKVIDQLGTMSGGSDDLVAEAEQETGLDLPEDLQTLLGDAITVSLGGDAPESVDELESFENVPTGVLIHGDADKIRAIIAKVEERTGFSLSDIPIGLAGNDDKLALSPSNDYADDLLGNGDLGSNGGFQDVVPEADKASGLWYVDFQSSWRDLIADVIADEDGDSAAKEFDDNTEPLKSMGASAWLDGEISHLLVKVTTD